MVIEDFSTTSQEARERQRPKRAKMCTVVKAARTTEGKVVAIVPGGMVDVALRELGARLTGAERL